MAGRSIDLRSALIVGATLMVIAFLYTAGGSNLKGGIEGWRSNGLATASRHGHARARAFARVSDDSDGASSGAAS